MAENESNPVLISSKPLKSIYAKAQKIAITTGDFTLGRGQENSCCIPFCAISRNHCTFKKTHSNEWFVEDYSHFGIKINNVRLGNGAKRKLEHQDVISLEPTNEFTYKFIIPSEDVFEVPRKRIKMEEQSSSSMEVSNINTKIKLKFEEPDSTGFEESNIVTNVKVKLEEPGPTHMEESNIITNVKLKFEESQKCEIQHIEDKIQNAKQMQTTSMTLKKQLQEDMNRKIHQLESEFSVQIENLKGEKNEVEKQKALLIEERDVQLSNVKHEMEGKIAELMEQITKHNETESELLKENNQLKDKLTKEREDFLSELNRESSSKQDMLDKLEAKIREQEEIRVKEKQELEETLKRETEQLRLAKERELQELEELKQQREEELNQELSSIRKNLAEQVEQTKQQSEKAELELKLQIDQMKQLQAEEKARIDQFQKEKDEIQKKLIEAQNDAEKSKVESQARVVERETELAALAAERIQKQVDQSSEVISTLQDQLEKVKSQLQLVESEKNTLLENICTDSAGEGSSKQETLNEFSELMESELQCSICAELFVEATTLNCSHTFCKYCITTWKKKKRDCPICRTSITSECKSLVLDSFIEKMVQSLTDEMKRKRQDMLKYRAAEVQSSSRKTKTTSNTMTTARRRTTTRRTTGTNSTSGRGGGSGAPSTGLSTIRTTTIDLTAAPIPMRLTERPPVFHQPLLQRADQIPTVDLTQSPANQIPTPAPRVHRRMNPHQNHATLIGMDQQEGPQIIMTVDGTMPSIHLTTTQASTTYHSLIQNSSGQDPEPVPNMEMSMSPPMSHPLLRQDMVTLMQQVPETPMRPAPAEVPQTSTGPSQIHRPWTDSPEIPRDLLTVAIPMHPGDRPPPGAPVRLLRHVMQETGRSPLMGILGERVVSSQGLTALITAVTDAASRAVRAATGPPDAPSDNANNP